MIQAACPGWLNCFTFSENVTSGMQPLSWGNESLGSDFLGVRLVNLFMFALQVAAWQTPLVKTTAICDTSLNWI